MSRRPSPLDNEQCRQCSSFQDYMKSTKKKLKNEDSVNSASNGDDATARRSDCPLDKNELGTSTWGLLHTIAATYPDKPTSEQKCDMKQFLTLLSKFYPCHACAEDLRAELKVDPPKTDSQEVLSQWLCRLHNKVNIKLGKEVFDCSKVNERWRDGWSDGSCD
nr:unnamed protein product [Callosobruchus chinensis]